MSPWATADAGDIGDIAAIPSLKFEGIQMEQGIGMEYQLNLTHVHNHSLTYAHPHNHNSVPKFYANILCYHPIFRVLTCS